MYLGNLRLMVERVRNFDIGSGMTLEERADTGSAPGRGCVTIQVITLNWPVQVFRHDDMKSQSLKLMPC